MQIYIEYLVTGHLPTALTSLFFKSIEWWFFAKCNNNSLEFSVYPISPKIFSSTIIFIVKKIIFSSIFECIVVRIFHTNRRSSTTKRPTKRCRCLPQTKCLPLRQLARRRRPLFKHAANSQFNACTMNSYHFSLIRLQRIRLCLADACVHITQHGNVLVLAVVLYTRLSCTHSTVGRGEAQSSLRQSLVPYVEHSIP